MDSADTSTPASDDQHDSYEIPDSLRSLAGLVGALLVIAGVVAVFLSDNEIGTGVLLLAGAGLLLLAIQGTQLIRIGAGSMNLEWAERKARQEASAEMTKEARSGSHSPEVALGMLEAAQLIDPTVTARHPELRWVTYEYEVEAALRRLALLRGATVSQYSAGVDRGIDFVIAEESGDRQVHVLVKYRSRGPLNPRDLHIAESPVPLLVVTNAPLGPDALEHNSSSTGLVGERPYVEYLTWAREDDDDLLHRALNRAFAAA